MRRQVTLTIGIVFTTWLLWAAPIFAQTRTETLQQMQVNTETTDPKRFSLEVSPPVKYIQIKPGAKLSHTITLKNIGAFALEITPKVVDFVPDGETSSPILKDSTNFSYIEMPERGWPMLTLRPNQTAQLTINFSVPSDAPEKEYPLTILFEQHALTDAGAGSRVTGSVGSNLVVLISNQNTPSPELEITSLGVFPLLDTFSSLTVEPLISNRGISAQAINGTVTIRNWRGTVLEEFTLFPDVILGNSSRRARAQSTLSEDGEVTDPVAIQYQPDWLLGLYQIDLQLTTIEPGTEDAPVHRPLAQQRVTVIALPYVGLIVLAVSLLLALLYRSLTVKKVRL